MLVGSCYCMVCSMTCVICMCVVFFFFFQAEDGIRDLVRSRGLGDVYKRQFLNVGRVSCYCDCRILGVGSIFITFRTASPD